MATATLLPPLRPMARIAGTPKREQTSSARSLLSTTLTKPTGTPTTREGRSPASLRIELRRAPGGGDRARGPLGPGLPGHGLLRHEAVRRGAQARKARLAHAGKRHVRIQHERRAGAQRGTPRLHRAGREAQRAGKVEVRRGVDDPADHRGAGAGEADALRLQFRVEDGKARALDVPGQVVCGQMRIHQNSTPSRARTPRAYGWRWQRISVE